MDGLLLDERLTTTVLGVLAASLGVIFLVVQARSKTTLGLGLFWMAVGLYAFTIPLVANQVDEQRISLFERLHGVCDGLVAASVCLYISGLMSTAYGSAPTARTMVRSAVRVAYALAVLGSVLGFVFPAERANDYLWGLGDASVLGRQGFWIFASYYVAVAATFAVAWVGLARQELDQGEQARAVCGAVAVPFLAFSTALPYALSALSLTVALLLLLLGMFFFFAAQGERDVFLTRFLSPQVSEAVRLQGLASVMQPREVDLTVVACDLRGFTSYAEAVPSQAVVDLLGEYYDSIGDVVAEVNGTIKDFAGDGILVLVGAPLTRPDHASVGLALAARVLQVGHRVTERWSTGLHPLGLGVGVASGRVTVGAVGSNGRSEYTAVGAPVNLAARLCSAAADGEILVDARTAELAGTDGLESRGAVQLKGLSGEVRVFAVPDHQL